MNKLHTFGIVIDWRLIATVRSVGASTRIEGSMMSDSEVEVLLQNMNIDKLEDRDSQEVVGYFEVFDLISKSADSIDISENSLKNLHNQLLKYSSKAQRPGENITTWVLFFLKALKNIQVLLFEKLESTGIEAKLSPREKSIIAFLSDHPGSKSGVIASRLNIPNPTVKRLLKDLVTINLIEVFGSGPGTNYAVK